MTNPNCDDSAQRLAVETALHMARDNLYLPAAAVRDLAERAIRAGADVSSVGVTMPCGSSLEHWARDLKFSDPTAAHFWTVPKAPLTSKASNKKFDQISPKRRATAKLDAANGVDDEVRL